MPVYPKAGVSLDVDSSDWDAEYKKILKEAGNLDSLAPSIKPSVDDADLKKAVGLANDLNQNTSTKANVDDSEVKSTKDKLDDIATIGAIDLAINIAGNAQGFIEGLGRFSGIGGIMELDTALATIEARTGKMIPQAEELINKLYTNGWGESRTQIAGVVAQASQLGLEGDALEAAVLATLQVVSVTGGDATETLNKLDTASKANGRTFTETADLYIAGFQTGNDKADDLLDTLSEYGTTFSNFRLSAEGAMAFLDSGLNAGVFNSDVLADSVRELGIRLASIGTDENVTKAFEDLDKLSDVDLAGMLDGYKAGTVTGDEMLQGIIDALGGVAATDPATATTLGASIVGTQLEDMGISVFSKLSTDADAAFGDIEGRAETAGNTISDTLDVTVDTFLRGIEQMAVDFLSSDAVDLDGKIEVLKGQLQNALSTIAEGGSIGEALEIGFGIEGVDTALANIGRVFGQFTLTLLEIVAAIQDPLGINDADAGTRGQIATMATQQLPFDLSVANPNEFDAIFTQAAQRGVSLADMGTSLTTAMDASVAEGDFDRTKEILADILSNPDLDPVAGQVLVDKYNAAIEEAMAAANPPAPPPSWTAGFSGLHELMAKTPIDLKTAPSSSGAKGMGWWSNLTPPPETVTAIDTVSEAVTTAQTDITAAGDATAAAVTVATDAVVASTEGAALAVQLMDTDIAAAMMGNTVTASFEAVEDTAVLTMAGTVKAVQSVTPHILQLDALLKQVAAAAASVQSSVNTAVAGAGAGGGGGGNTTNVTVTQNNNVQSPAQAASTGYQLGAQIRGMG